MSKKTWNGTGLTYTLQGAQENQIEVAETPRGYAFRLAGWDSAGYGPYVTYGEAVTEALREVKHGAFPVIAHNLSHPTLRKWLEVWEKL